MKETDEFGKVVKGKPDCEICKGSGRLLYHYPETDITPAFGYWGTCKHCYGSMKFIEDEETIFEYGKAHADQYHRIDQAINIFEAELESTK